MLTVQTDLTQLKQRLQAMWTAGDFGRVARILEAGALQFVARLGMRPGMRVLDVACGTGSLALPAARLGAEVTGVDIAPNLLQQARERAASEQLMVQFDEGDVEQMPYADSYFDLTMSMFGAMFAPRPERAAAELLRVTRPGGRVAMANWTPDGLVGEMAALGSRYVPPPAGLPSPLMWGEEACARDRLGPGASRVDATSRTITFDFPFDPRGVVAFYREYFGPTRLQFENLDAGGQDAYAADLERLWRDHNEARGNRTVVTADYLEVRAIRA